MVSGFNRQSTLVALAATLLVACRPEIELEIGCQQTGDLACPTGYHCGAQNRCEPGEAPPRLVFASPSGGARLTAGTPTEIIVNGTSPRGVGTAKLRVVAKADGKATDVSVTEKAGDAARRSVTITAAFEHWKLTDGDYELEVSAGAATGDATPSTVRLPITIAVGAPLVEITSPDAERTVADDFAVSAHVTSPRKPLTLELAVNAIAGATVYAVSATEGSDVATGTLPVTTLPNAAYELVATATDAQGTKAEAKRRLVVEVPAPAFTIVEPAAFDAPFAGKLHVKASVTSKRALQNVGLTLDETFGSVALEEKTIAADHHSATFEGEIDTTLLADGEYPLRAQALDSLGTVHVLGRTLKVANAAPVVAITKPLEAAAVKGTTSIEFGVTCAQRIDTIVVALEREGADTQIVTPAMTWESATTRRAGTGSVSVDTATLAEGAWRVVVHATHAFARTATVERNFFVENAPFAFAETSTRPGSRTVAARVRVLFSKSVPAPPLLTITGWNPVPQPSADQREFVWELSPHPSTIAATTQAKVSATDRFGTAIEKTLAVELDEKAPSVVGDVVYDKRLAALAPSAVAFTCAEDASWAMTASGTATGSCAAGETVSTAARADTVPSVKLTDALGNAATYRATKAREEVATNGDAVTLRRAAGFPFFAPTAGASAGDALLAKADGNTRQVIADFAVSAAPVGLRLGGVRRTRARPIPFDEGAANVRFAIVDGDVLSTYEVNADGSQRLLGALPVVGTFRPAWDPNARAWIHLDPATRELVESTLQRRVRALGFAPPTTSLDAIVCGNQYVAVWESAGLIGGLTVTLPTGAPLALLARSPWGSPSNARLTCDGATPALVMSDNTLLRAYQLGSTTWMEGAQSPAFRSEFVVSSKGHVASGLISSGAASFTYRSDVLKLENGSFVPVTESGPRRAGGALVARTPLVALGGTGPAEVGFVASAADGYAEHPLPAPSGYFFRENTVYDYARGALVHVDTVGGTRVWELGAAGTWVSAPVPNYDVMSIGYAVALGTPAKVLFGGGMATGAPGIGSQQAFLWDGVSAGSVDGVATMSAPAAVIDGKALLVGPDKVRQTTGSWVSFTRAAGTPSILQQLYTTAGDSKLRALGTDGGLKYVELALNGTTLETTRAVPITSNPTASLVLPWREALVGQFGFAGAGAWELIPLTSAQQPPISLPALSAAAWNAPAPARRVLVARGQEEPPLMELSDEPVPAWVAKLSAGTWSVQACARTDLGGTKLSEARYELVTDDELRTLTPQTQVISGGASPCQRATFEVTVGGEARLVVSGTRATQDAQASLVLDELVVSKTYVP